MKSRKNLRQITNRKTFRVGIYARRRAVGQQRVCKCRNGLRREGEWNKKEQWRMVGKGSAKSANK